MMLLISKSLCMIDSVMMKLTHIQCIVAMIGVCINHAIWLDVKGYFVHERLCLGILYHHGIHLAMALEHAKDDHFPGSASTAFTFADSTEIAFIDFNVPLEYFMSFFGKMKRR